MRKPIRLTESILHKIIVEAVNQLLTEAGNNRVEVSSGIWVTMDDKELKKWAQQKKKAKGDLIKPKRPNPNTVQRRSEVEETKKFILKQFKKLMSIRKLATFFKSGSGVFFGGNKLLTLQKIGNIERYYNGAERTVINFNNAFIAVQNAKTMGTLKDTTALLYDACDNVMHKIDAFLTEVDRSQASQLRGISRIFTYPNYGLNDISIAFNQDVKLLPEVMQEINGVFEFRSPYQPWSHIGGQPTLQTIMQKATQPETPPTPEKEMSFADKIKAIQEKEYQERHKPSPLDALFKNLK